MRKIVFRETLKKKRNLCCCLQRLFQTHSKTSALRLKTDELFLHVGKYMPFFRRKLQRNLRIKFWKSDVLASLTSSDRVSLLSCSQDSDSLIRHATAISLFPFYWARLWSVLHLKWSSLVCYKPNLLRSSSLWINTIRTLLCLFSSRLNTNEIFLARKPSVNKSHVFFQA